jgi:linoleoyl-CoA desaturase
MASLAISYLLLVFAAHAWWQSVPLAVVIGFRRGRYRIQHSTRRRTPRVISDRRWINKLMAVTLDLIGGSSYLWRWKHGVHSITRMFNVTGHDSDLNLGIFGRVTPHQRGSLFTDGNTSTSGRSTAFWRSGGSSSTISEG